MKLTKKEAIELVEKQMDHQTQASGSGKDSRHYGWCEIKELLNTIYGDTSWYIKGEEVNK